jgi:hypothetical protein
MTEKKPYDLQRLYAEKAGGPFEFTWGDRTWTLPNLLMLDIEVQDRIENVDPSGGVESFNQLFDDIMGAEQGAEWRKQVRPLPMLMDLLQAWTEHSGAQLGEAPASAGSSKSTARPSKRTSTGSTASASRGRSRAAKKASPRASS